MNIFNKLKKDIVNTGQLICNDNELLQQASVEMPKNSLNGELSSNIAMIIASKESKNPQEVALKFKELLMPLDYITDIKIAGSGFINFALKVDIWYESIKEILRDAQDFAKVDIGGGKKINIEYVSANPTGPLHVGHARGAVYGDALARLLSRCGYQVLREYYVNDAGSQVDILTKSATLRYQAALTGKTFVIPEGYYPGEYLIPIGQQLAASYGNKLLDLPSKEASEIVKKFTVEHMLGQIRADLKELGIEHEVLFSEQSLHDNGSIEQAIKELSDLGLIYEGELPPPKGMMANTCKARKQLLFKSTAFGDDQDRPLTKDGGEWTYLAVDIAYAKDKIARGFTDLIYVLGADHSGYIKRIEAVVKALGKGRVTCCVKVCQLVNYIQNGSPVKMSKRSGNFTTVRDVKREVGKDILRFMMLTRKNDAPLDFDFAKVKEQSKDNPVFYAHYAHVRALSILKHAKENLPAAYQRLLNNDFDLTLLAAEDEIQMIKQLALWPKILQGAAVNYEPHRIAFYILQIAAKFHAMWNLGKENNNYRFVVKEDINLTAARLGLVKSIQKIIILGFDIIGIEPLDNM